MNRLLPSNLAYYVSKAKPILVRIAKQITTIKYGELIKEMNGPGRGYIAEVLEELSKFETQQGHPKITALVVRKDTGMVSGGFFGLPKTPENVRRTTPEGYNNPKLSAQDIKYWEEQKQKVYDYWQKQGSI